MIASRILSAPVALALLLQLMMAPLHCLSAMVPAAGDHAICPYHPPAERSAHVDGDHPDLPDRARIEVAFCLHCGAFGHGPAPSSGVPAVPEWPVGHAGWTAEDGQAPSLGRPFPPFRSTGPPVART